MPEVVIVDAVRTPVGRRNGGLSTVHPADLLAAVFSGLVERTGIDPSAVGQVITGCVSQVGEQSFNIGRTAWLTAGFPLTVAATTVDTPCGSSQQATNVAAALVGAGVVDVAIASGVESMSRVPMGSARMGADPFGPSVARRFPSLVPQGVSAELVADKWGLSRAALDEYSVQSHQRAAATAAAGGFDNEIVPLTTPEGTVVSADETIRPGTTAERLATLSAAFGTPEFQQRLPQIDWKITAGNSSQITDGAGAILVTSAERAAALGLRPRARIVASAVVGDDPTLMLTGPIPATARVLERAGLSIDDIDAVEVNEAFAPVPLAWLAEYPVDPVKLNPRGGAIALGHPLGASGIRLMSTLINHLEQTGGRYGLQTMCEAGGMANASIIEIIR